MGRGDGTFPTALQDNAGRSPGSVAVGDFDRDGHEDLVAANKDDNVVTALLGYGDGTFAAPMSFAAGSGPYSVAVGDFDRDGREDLVTANESSADVTILLGHGDGTFAAPSSYTAGDQPRSLQSVMSIGTAWRTSSRRTRVRVTLQCCWAAETGPSPPRCTTSPATARIRSRSVISIETAART